MDLHSQEDQTGTYKDILIHCCKGTQQQKSTKTLHRVVFPKINVLLMRHQLMHVYNAAHRHTCVTPTRTSVRTGLGVGQCTGMDNYSLHIDVTSQQQERLYHCVTHGDVLYQKSSWLYQRAAHMTISLCKCRIRATYTDVLLWDGHIFTSTAEHISVYSQRSSQKYLCEHTRRLK